MTQPTPAQVLAALQNYRKGPRTKDARTRDSLQHAHTSKQKPAILAGIHEPVNTETNRHPHYGSEST
jgi:hypothetical protein